MFNLDLPNSQKPISPLADRNGALPEVKTASRLSLIKTSLNIQSRIKNLSDPDWTPLAYQRLFEALNK